jgi:RNA polymerase sigma-70 factor (ECF subfamily)
LSLPGKRGYKEEVEAGRQETKGVSEEETFQELIRRVRAGDAQASTELVRRYEPAIRLAVHVRLTDPGLRRLVDSLDICQSILASFFVRAASGQYELDTPGQLLRLLTTMARNKVVHQAQKQRAARRDYRRMQKHIFDEGDFIDSSPGPSEVVTQQEILHALRSRLTAEERRLAEQRASGRSWEEIAAEVGGQPNALRMRLTRALDRLTQELGLED